MRVQKNIGVKFKTNNYMERTIYHEVLALDLYYGLLSWYERILMHYLISGKPADITENMQKWIDLVEDLHWFSPENRVFADDDPHNIYYKVETKNGIEWLPVETYKANNPNITKQIIR